MEYLNILKIALLFLGVWLTLVNTGRFLKNNDISRRNIFLQALGIVGYIVIEFDMWK